MTAELIGFGGRLTSGKDTAADYLVTQHDWVKVNMSTPLHQMALVLNPWLRISVMERRVIDKKHDIWLSSEFYTYTELTNLLGYTIAKEVGEYRAFLQRFGTDVGRKMIDEDLWVKKADEAITSLRMEGRDVCITGIRFDNELAMIQDNVVDDLPGFLVWVERPGLASAATSHESERLTSGDFDVVLTNDGTLEDLYKTVEKNLVHG